MIKILTLIALFIGFVYSDNEHNVESQILPNEIQPPTNQDKDIKNNFHTIKAQYIEESKNLKPCKQNKNRRLNEDNPVLDSLPITETTEQVNTASSNNKFVTTAIHGANYKYKTEDTDTETNNSELSSKNCGCGNCLLETNKKVLQFESLALDYNINPLNRPEMDNAYGETIESNNNYIENDALNVNPDKFVSEDSDKHPDNVPNINNSEYKKPCNNFLNVNARRKKCGTIDLEKLSSIQTSRRILPGLIDNPTEQEQFDNRLYQDNPQEQEKTDDGMEHRQNYFPNVHKISNAYGIDVVQNMNVNDGPDHTMPIDESLESQLIEPTKGKGIYDMKDTGVMLLENSRVCYACSTISDPTCWTPDRRTTVKYCRKGHKSCLTKTFKHKGKSVIIRDCGNKCVNYNSEEKYSSCSICHSDVCNGASSISIFNTSIAFIVLLGISYNKF